MWFALCSSCDLRWAKLGIQHNQMQLCAGACEVWALRPAVSCRTTICAQIKPFGGPHKSQRYGDGANQ